MTATEFDRLLADVKQSEGFRPTPYLDSVGVLTVGYGQRVDELTVTEAQAGAWCVARVQEALDEARRFPWFQGLSDGRQRAVVELLYNLGLPKFNGFVKMQKALANHDYATAAAELLNSQWAGQVGIIRAGRVAALVRG